MSKTSVSACSGTAAPPEPQRGRRVRLAMRQRSWQTPILWPLSNILEIFHCLFTHKKSMLFWMVACFNVKVPLFLQMNLFLFLRTCSNKQLKIINKPKLCGFITQFGFIYDFHFCCISCPGIYLYNSPFLFFSFIVLLIECQY